MSEFDLESLPIRIDPHTFAEQNRELHGLVATKSMQRLKNNLRSAEPVSEVRLRFSKGSLGYPLVQGEAHVKVTVRCERCLDDMDICLDPHIEVLLKPSDDRLPDKSQNDEESPDFHDYDGDLLTLSDLIEEELLLAMPLVPRHEDISLCNQDMIAWLALNEGPKADAKRAENPFAILKR